MGFNFRAVYAITVKNLQSLLKDRRSVGLLVGMPIVLMLFFGYGFGQEVQNVPIQVVNLDEGGEGIPHLNITAAYFSEQILDSLEKDSRVQLNHLDAADFDYEEAIKGISGAKEVYALLIIPPDFTENLPFQTEPITIQLIVDGAEAQPIAAVQSALQEAVNSLLELQPNYDPPLSIEIDYIEGSEDLRPFDSMAPGVLSLAILLFAILTVTGGLTREKLTGTIERVFASEGTRVEILAGYMIGNSLICLVQCALLIIVATLIFDIVIIGSLLLLFAMLFVYSLACVGLGILLSSFANTELQAFQFIPMILIPFIFFSGFLFPIQSFPLPFQIFARIIPMTYSIRISRMIMINGASIGEFLPDFLILLAMLIIYMILAILSFRTRK